MTHRFDRDYWEQHWQAAEGDQPAGAAPPHPYFARELDGLPAATALDAGCGAGAGAVWLASRGWSVTGVDISASALARAPGHAADLELTDAVRWVEADLTIWEPNSSFDLVVTSYAHPAMPPLAFYTRLAGWVRPGGRLLVVAHRHVGAAADHAPPREATVDLADIVGLLPGPEWGLVTAEKHERTPPGQGTPLHDVVVHAARRGAGGPT